VTREQELLRLVEKLISLSQTGLAYSQEQYDRERYDQLRALTGELMQHLGAAPEALSLTFPPEIGYRTPKIDVRAIVLQDDAVLLVRERSDGRWAPPGGWADVGYSAARNAEKETLEETGYSVKAVRLLALLDRDLHAHEGGSPWHTYKAFFECALQGGSAQSSIETDGAEFFPLDRLPPLSSPRITEAQLRRVCEMIQTRSELPWFD
jgi:ADP-ribose pyrophosphatase YjhB (NUDIX family)